MLCAASIVVHAAPATSEELSSATAADPGSSTITRTPAVTGGTQVPLTAPVPQSKTVELLLQMQDQPTLTGQEGKAASDNPRRATATAPGKPAAAIAADSEPNPLGSLKATLLGNQAQTGRSMNINDRENNDRDSLRSTSSGGAGSVSPVVASGEPRESLLSNPVVRFIRENRSLVVGLSVAVLVGIWGTATFSMRRSR